MIPRLWAKRDKKVVVSIHTEGFDDEFEMGRINLLGGDSLALIWSNDDHGAQKIMFRIDEIV